MFVLEIYPVCENLPVPVNGFWDSLECNEETIIFPTSCKVICKAGYSLFGATDVIVCTENGDIVPNTLASCEGEN